MLYITGLSCLVMLTAYLIASWYPEGRIWGLNLWAYFPPIVPLGLFGGSVLVVAFIWFYGHQNCQFNDDTSTDIKRSIFWVASATLTLLMTVLFYYLRARTHFLGDGYTVLALLSDPEPLVKTREYGAAMLHVFVKQLYGEGEPAALKSFQTISIGCGFLFLLSTAFLSRRLFDSNRVRVLFLIGLASCGYMYNFFGYVENYSLFILTSMIYCMTGLLVSLDRASRWILLPLLGLTILSHIFGVVFVPGTIYLLFANTRIGNRIASLAPRRKWLIAIALFVIGAATFLHFYFNYYYFRFAIAPLFQDRFTVEGYHLFSVPHLLDMVNLALLLVPALPLVIVLAFGVPLKNLLRRSEYRYLGILLLSCWGAMFIFDPKLGMPRDWDLFSFVGVPMALLAFYLVLDIKFRSRYHVPIALMMTLLGFAILFPRAVSQTNPNQSVVWFNNYAALDKTKNMYGRTLLKQYYDRRDDAVASEQQYRQYVTDYPEFVLNHEGLALRREEKLEEAIEKFHEAIDLHPTFVAPYANLGMCYLQLGQLDSAEVMLRIAVGMNPYNSIIYNTLGRTYFEQGDYPRAEEMLLRAHKLSPSKLEPLVGLVKLYEKIRDLDSWLRYLNELIVHEDAPFQALTELAEYHLNHRHFAQAAPLLKRAVALGLDSTYVAQLQKKYPQLGL